MSVRFLNLEQVNQEFLLEIDKTIKEVFAGGQFVLGQKLEAFENEYAEFNGVGSTLGVGNGTDALLLCLKPLDVGQRDKVIVPSNTCIASAIAECKSKDDKLGLPFVFTFLVFVIAILQYLTLAEPAVFTFHRGLIWQSMTASTIIHLIIVQES